jgi:hypothetical protein
MSIAEWASARFIEAKQGSVIDMERRKIPVSAIEQLRRTLENTPECRIEEVTKVEAIRMLRPQIHAMRAKGYGLGAIAGLLSENGIAVTAVTLKGYLKQFKGGGGKSSARGNRQGRARDGAPATVPVKPLLAPAQGAHDKGAPSDATTGREAAAVPERGTPAGASSPVAAPVATTSKGSPRPAEGGPPRRSAFLPREDTEDI